MSDPRFARFKTDPRFRKLRKKQNKVVVDERFKSVFSKDKKSADKTGAKALLEVSKWVGRFYRLEGDEEVLASSVPDYARGGVLMESSDEEEATAEASESENDQPVVLGKTSQKPIPVEEELEVDLDESQFAELDALAKVNVEKSIEEERNASSSNAEKTSRLAVVNLDWDHVKASHLYKIFSSVVSPSSKKGASAIGKVLHVRVYPSEFGKTRMEHEAKAGPPQNIFKKRNDDQDIVEEDDGNEYDEDALRKYQLERLRYYYAIVTCDTPDAAAHIYSELDGTELERSANVFDLSYVPEEMSFDDDYTDEAREEKNNYKAVEFVTDALRHSKVKLTWDDDDPERVKMTRRTFSKKELEEADFKAFLASASSDEGEDDEDEARREKVRSLLLDGVDEDNELVPEGWGKDFEKGGEMKITFTPGLSGSNNIADQEETTRERYLRKQKEKRKKQKEERPQKGKQVEDSLKEDDFFGEDEDDEEPTAAGQDNRSGKTEKPEKANTADIELLKATLGDDREPNHFDMRAVIKAEKGKTKKHRKEKKKQGDHADEIQEDFVLDINDPRFKALHEDHAFAIDPSNPHFKKTKSMSALLDERAKRQRSRENVESSTAPKNSPPNDNDSRSLKNLVEKVKRKSSLHNDKKGETKRRKIS